MYHSSHLSIHTGHEEWYNGRNYGFRLKYHIGDSFKHVLPTVFLLTNTIIYYRSMFQVLMRLLHIKRSHINAIWTYIRDSISLPNPIKYYMKQLYEIIKIEYIFSNYKVHRPHMMI